MDTNLDYWFVNNRQVIKNLAVNTGTSQTPVWSNMCTMSEVKIDTDFEVKDFFVFCDSIKRSVITGSSLVLNTTIKIDMNNESIKTIIGNLHSLIKDGLIAQFNNVHVQFDLLENVDNSTNSLTYKRYEVPMIMKLSDLGGAAEDEGSFALEMIFNGKGTEVTE